MNPNGVAPPPPPAPLVGPDQAFALHVLEIANTTLALMAGQLAKFAARSPQCAQVQAMFQGMAGAAAGMHAEMLRQVTSGIVVANAGDVPRLR